MIKAIIFDFDGLIADTERTDYESWQALYDSYNCLLPYEQWVEGIGTHSFDPYNYLEEQLDTSPGRAALRAKRRELLDELMKDRPLLPGAEDYLQEAVRLGLKIGLASSSTKGWVYPYLAQYAIEHYFQSIKCADDVAHVKPDPALYLLSLQALGIEAREAIVLEDSLHGVRAAKKAGIFCVAVPNPFMTHLSYHEADLRLSALTDLSLEELLAKAK